MKKETRGRKPLKLTKKQKVDRINARNAERSEKYKSDSEFRKRQKEISRSAYAKKVGALQNQHQVVDQSMIELFGEERTVLKDAEGLSVGDEHHLFTAEEVAEVLGGYSPQVIKNWIQEGKLPTMDVLSECQSNNANGTFRKYTCYCYPYYKIFRIAEILRQHQKYSAYYRSSHKETIAKIMRVGK